MALKQQIEILELKKQARKRMDRKLTMGIIPDLDDSSYNILDQVPNTINDKVTLVDSIKNTAAELAASIDRKILHRE